MIIIRSSFPGDKSSWTNVGVPQGKGKSIILTTESKEPNTGLRCTYCKKKNHLIENCPKKKKKAGVNTVQGSFKSS